MSIWDNSEIPLPEVVKRKQAWSQREATSITAGMIYWKCGYTEVDLGLDS